jgi:hypothetical protein
MAGGVFSSMEVSVPERVTSDYWASPLRVNWVLQQERLDELFAPLSHTTMEQAAPMPGEQALARADERIAKR